MDWQIYYEDGSSFDSSQGTPAEAPPVGVIVIVQCDLTPPHKRELVKGDNYYYWSPAMQWQGIDRDGVIDALLERKDVIGLKQGRRVTRIEYNAFSTVAHQHPDFQ